MNPSINALHPYPFERLAAIKAAANPPADKSFISLSIGEPKHPAPEFIKQALIANVEGVQNYPTTRGNDSLRETICQWLIDRFQLPDNSLAADKNVLPVNGTREALFAIAQCVIDDQADDPIVLSPNPFYQIYEGAAILAKAKPVFLNCTKETGYSPDFDSIPDTTWEQCQLIYLCSPGNPTGAVISESQLARLLALSDRFNFVIAADECYSEIYFDEENPPTGLLEAAANMGRTDYKNCLVFHSLSKRSNLPGLRSGFVAGDANLIKQFLLYRTYHGCSMPPPTQAASIIAWQDEQHVQENRRLYREKFDAVLSILSPVLDVQRPDASFYLWPEVPQSDTAFASGLLNAQNVLVLPGSFLARNAEGINPGANRVRIALVASTEECVEAAYRIRNYIESI